MTRTTRPAHTGRLLHLDNLKAALVAWIIGGHALLGYSAVGGWPYDEVNEVTFTPLSELILLSILGPSSLVVIGLFFFIAGLLAEQAVRRRGWRHYTRERLLRLGLPWLVSAAAVWPASVWIAYRAAGRPVSFWWVLTHRDPLLDSGSLWFALVLMLFSVVFAAGWTLWSRAAAPPAAFRPVTAVGLVASTGAIAFSSFVLRLWFPGRGRQIGDLHLWWWPECAGLFALGIIVARRGWIRHIPDRMVRGCGIAALSTLGLLPLLAIFGRLPSVARDLDPFLGGWHWQAAATAVVESTLVVTCSVWLVGLAERRLAGTGERVKHWVHAAFTAFVIQGPVLMILASVLRALDLPAEIKAPLLAVAAIVACFGIGRFVPHSGDRVRSSSARHAVPESEINRPFHDADGRMSP